MKTFWKEKAPTFQVAFLSIPLLLAAVAIVGAQVGGEKREVPKAEVPRKAFPEKKPKPAAPAPEVQKKEGRPIGPKPEIGQAPPLGKLPAVKAKEGDKIWFNFENAEIRTVLKHLSEVAGLVVLVKDGDLDGRITVQSRKPLSVDEAVAVLNSVLKEVGYAGVRVGKTLKIVKLEEALRSSIPVRTGVDPEEIPETDEIVTQIIPLKRISARDLRQDLEPLFSDKAIVSANEDSNTLIVTDTSANIKKIAKIIYALDSSQTQVAKVEVFPLKYADATDAARLITLSLIHI